MIFYEGKPVDSIEQIFFLSLNIKRYFEEEKTEFHALVYPKKDRIARAILRNQNEPKIVPEEPTHTILMSESC